MAYHEDDTCLRCGKPIDHAASKWLELSFQTGLYAESMPSDEPDKPKRAGRHRQCWNCGADMGWIENRYYSPGDVCGQPACNRAAQNAEREEREEAHRELDERMGW